MKDQLNKAWKKRCKAFAEAEKALVEVKKMNERLSKLNMDDHYPLMIELSDRILSILKTAQEIQDYARQEWGDAVDAAGRKIILWQIPGIGYDSRKWECVLDDGRVFKS